MLLINTAKHSLHLSEHHTTATKGDRLIGQTQGITHTAIGGFGKKL